MGLRGFTSVGTKLTGLLATHAPLSGREVMADSCGPTPFGSYWWGLDPRGREAEGGNSVRCTHRTPVPRRWWCLPTGRRAFKGG